MYKDETLNSKKEIIFHQNLINFTIGETENLNLFQKEP